MTPKILFSPPHAKDSMAYVYKIAFKTNQIILTYNNQQIDTLPSNEWICSVDQTGLNITDTWNY